VARARAASAAFGRGRSAAAPSGVVTGADRPALLLLAAWIGYRLYPYVPTLDLTKYWHAVRPVLLNPLPHGSDPFRLCLMWLLCCMLVEASAGAPRTVRLFPLLAGAILAAKVVIVDNAVTSGDLAGACVAYVLWLLLFRRAPARHAILALFFAAMLAALRLAPSAPHGSPWGFGWLSLLDRAFLYGGLIWLVNQAGMKLLYATLATAALLLVTGVAATHGYARPAVIADAAMAIGVGALFRVVNFSPLRRSRP
jgi:hypothetical protein